MAAKLAHKEENRTPKEDSPQTGKQEQNTGDRGTIKRG